MPQATSSCEGWLPRARSSVFVGILLGTAVPSEVWVCGHGVEGCGFGLLLGALRLPGTRLPAHSSPCGLGPGFACWQRAEVSSCWPGFIRSGPLVSERAKKSFGACGSCVFWV